MAFLLGLFAASAYAEIIKCQNCSKMIDEKNSSCPYCLSDLNSKPLNYNNVQNKQDESNIKKTAAENLISPAASDDSYSTSRPKNERLISEQQAQAFFENLLNRNKLKSLIKITGFKRELKNTNKFKVIGEVTSNEGKPLKALSFIIETCQNSAAMTNVNLSKAAKIDIENPRLMSFNILFNLDPKYVKNTPLTPVEFNFVVPNAANSNETVCDIKIFKKNADSEDTLYEAQHKPGDKVTLNILPDPGCNIVVNINGKKVYEKNY